MSATVEKLSQQIPIPMQNFFPEDKIVTKEHLWHELTSVENIWNFMIWHEAYAYTANLHMGREMRNKRTKNTRLLQEIAS